MGIQLTGIASGMDTASMIEELMSVENTKVTDIEKEITKLEWKEEIWDDVNTQLYSFYKEELFDFKSSGTYNSKSLTSANESIVEVKTSNSAVLGSHTIDVSQLAKGSYLTSDELADTISSSTTLGELISFDTDEVKSLFIGTNGSTTDAANEITLEADDTIADLLEKIEDLDLDINVNYDTNYNRIFLSSKNTGDGQQLDLNANGDSDVSDLLSNLGFSSTTGTLGQNAVFTYNDATLESDDNTISVNGLSMVLRGEGETTVSVTQDVDAVYDTVKAFVEKYNELMDMINEKLDADSAREYEPLTSEEKDAMTDDEIETWETTIKDSLLRNDDILTSIKYALRSTLTTSSGVDTSDFTYNYLSDLGIVTGSYSEGGTLHIYGDEDDSTYSLKTNMLKEAIEEDPDAVMELFTALGEQLYDTLNTKMKSTSVSSAMTFYNDKSITSQIDDYEDRIDDLQDRLDEIEDRYYSQFTAMEQAIQESNSTADWLSQQLASL